MTQPGPDQVSGQSAQRFPSWTSLPCNTLVFSERTGEVVPAHTEGEQAEACSRHSSCFSFFHSTFLIVQVLSLINCHKDELFCSALFEIYSIIILNYSFQCHSSFFRQRAARGQNKVLILQAFIGVLPANCDILFIYHGLKPLSCGF